MVVVGNIIVVFEKQITAVTSVYSVAWANEMWNSRDVDMADAGTDDCDMVFTSYEPIKSCNSSGNKVYFYTTANLDACISIIASGHTTRDVYAYTLPNPVGAHKGVQAMQPSPIDVTGAFIMSCYMS